MLCAMKKVPDNDLDQLFADALGGLKAEAPEKVWRSVSSVVSGGGVQSSGLLTRIIKLATWFSSGIIILFVSYLTINNFQNHSSDSALPGFAMNQTDKQLFAAKPLIFTQNQTIPLPANKTLIYNQSPNPKLIENSANNSAPTQNYTSIPDERPIETTVFSPNYTKIDIPIPDPISLHKSSEINLPNLDITIPFSTIAVDSWYLPPVDYARPTTTTLVFSKGPDVFAFDANLFDASRSDGWNTGLSSRFQFSEFFFSAGINLIGVRQRNPYDYTINEFLQVGEYTHVDSVVMVETTDTLGNIIFIPQYYTSQLPLMDSVPVIHRTNVYDHYRFLEIPFTIGMRKDYKRFSFMAQTGFAYTFNIGNNEMSLEQFEEKSGFQLLDWQKQSFGRLQHFWSFNFALGASYALTNKVAIGIEPSYRYFVEPFYEGSQPDRKSPFSFGCRFNIQYSL